ncbi:MULTISPECIES: septum site-determining protein MinD [Thermoactinomyces]|uniref:Septum site-determining protein MinD n=1 Tax=Thermoactinomyces vulgaris TaxID=2026 RepID=A0ABS0QE87_THEVU|nr:MULTISPECIES: septum site-determining protein MinD [Thermoactinomyces]KFZ41162.1 cell division inhibitor MinD [Thermoactinomyces sp. Gus2-1]KYQ87661.1 septum site-determining protein MinD [Thermoactinomyces sp. AS95]MBA4550219.1 septum site-determining protein MinD [Thermoactinomyces vulgaris]MBA4595630.1 septum site-determining protein MinD [Thermoactinomyces vulgaris]MBH8582102.1 septum site-determining protein MinD [Thermoactinomyces sp. CICC 10735]
MGESVLVTSGKGGVGKSTTSVNIGTALALSGKKVCLVDADIGLRNLDVLMGLENRIIYDLIDVLEKKCRIEQALIKDKRCDELYLMPAAQTRDKTAVSRKQMRWLIAELKEQFDYVFIDCPAGIDVGFKNAVSGADAAIVVTTPENAAIRDADRVIGLLEKEEVAAPKLVVNRLRKQMARDGSMMDVDEVVAVLAVDLLGVVPDDEQVIRAGHTGEPIVYDHRNPAGKAYRNIARRIQGEMVPLMVLEKEAGVFTKMKKWLGFA